MQQDIFGGESPMPSAATDSPTIAAPRRPGWFLVASNRQGPRYWHRLATRETGTLVTVCGIRGHLVGEDQRQIVLCPACEAELED